MDVILERPEELEMTDGSIENDKRMLSINESRSLLNDHSILSKDKSVQTAMRTASSSEILPIADNHSETRSRTATELSLSSTTKQSSSTIERLKLEKKGLEYKIHTVQAERSRAELEREIELEQERNRYDILQTQLQEYESKLAKAKEHLEHAKRKKEEISVRKERLQNEAQRLSQLNLTLVADTHVLDDRTKRVGLTVEDYSKKLGVETSPEAELPRVASHDYENFGGIAGFEKKRGILRRFPAQTARMLTKRLFASRHTSTEPKVGSLQHQLIEAQKENAYLKQLIMDAENEQKDQAEVISFAEGDEESRSLNMT